MDYKYQIFADYFHFYVEDEGAQKDFDAVWSKELVDNRLAVREGYIAVGTIRNMTVPVTITILETLLSIEEHSARLNAADHCAECSLQVRSGKIVVLGTTDFYPDALRIDVKPDVYKVRIYYNKLNSLKANGLDGDDSYELVLYPSVSTPPAVLKRYDEPI